MTQKATTVSIKGLSLLPNDLSIAPDGSCSTCDNVRLRRPGCLEPAEKLSSQLLLDITGDDTIFKSHADALDGYVVNFVKNTGTSNTATGLQIQNPDTLDAAYFTDVPDSSTDARTLQFEPGRTHVAFSRDRRIVAGERSPVTLTRNTADTAWELRISGMQQPGSLIGGVGATAGAGDAIVAPDGTQAYYKAVYLRRYKNYDLYSAPSAPFLVVNDSGSACSSVIVQILSNPAVTTAQTGDIAVVYRTPFVDIGTDPGDAFQECVRGFVDTGVGFLVLVEDVCPDGALGAYLYTNSQQEGELQANYPPPDSRGVVTYNDTTFYVANLDWPTMSFGISDYGVINDGAVVGIYTGTATSAGSGATFITFAGDVTSVLVPGMVLDHVGGSRIGYVTTVTLVGPNTRVDFSNAFGLPGVAGYTGASSVTASDSIQFDFLTYDGTTDTELFWYQSTNPWQLPFDITLAAEELGGIGVVALQVPAPPSVTLTLTQLQPGRVKSFTITVSHGEAYTQMDNVDLATHSAVKASVQRNGTSTVYFSKTSFPEAVPPSNRLEIGHGEILRVISDNNSWYALCTDGVYRVTGVGNDWTVIQVSKTARLVHPDAACVHNGVVYAWFADGVAQVTESGCSNFSDMAIGPLLQPEAKRVLQNWRDIWGTFLVAHDVEHELYLNISQWFAEGSSFVYSTTYVYNVLTQQWCTRTYLAAQSGAYNSELNTLYFGRNVTAAALQTADSESLGWADPVVKFNSFTAGVPGVLKEWIDCNLLIKSDVEFFDTSPANETLQFLFDEDLPIVNTVNWRLSTAWSLPREHITVPRRCKRRDELTFGFFLTGLNADEDPQSVYFNLQGLTFRYRVASETFQR